MKIGIYIDAVNINRNGGYFMKYDVLKEYCGKEGELIRMNTYLTYDRERGEDDHDYRNKQYAYYSVLRSFGYKVVSKPIRWFYSEDGSKVAKSDADINMAVDIMTQAKYLDKIFLLTGDGGFKKVVEAVQNMGVRVELIAFKNISKELTFESDKYTCGYLIPNMVPISGQGTGDWGEEDYVGRGVVYALHDGYGFLRYFMSDYTQREVFFHFSELPSDHYVNLDDVFEFSIVNSDRGLQAKELTLPLG